MAPTGSSRFPVTWASCSGNFCLPSTACKRSIKLGSIIPREPSLIWIFLPNRQYQGTHHTQPAITNFSHESPNHRLLWKIPTQIPFVPANGRSRLRLMSLRTTLRETNLIDNFRILNSVAKKQAGVTEARTWLLLALAATDISDIYSGPDPAHLQFLAMYAFIRNVKNHLNRPAVSLYDGRLA